MTTKPKPETKPRTIKLNNQQTEILEILYKFRYATVETVASYMELESSVYTYNRLRMLVARGYIARHYDGQYKIHGKPAIYYLLPYGIRTLKTNPKLNLKGLNASYRNRLASDQFMNRCLDIFKIYLNFKQLYSSALSFYSKSEITGNEYFYSPLPDAYLRLKTKGQDTKHFILEVIEDNLPLFKVRKRITRYIDHFDESDNPSLLLVCGSPLLATQTQRLSARLLERAGMDDELGVYTTTIKALFEAKSKKTAVWSDVLEAEDLVSLDMV